MPIENRLRAAEGQWGEARDEAAKQAETLAGKASRVAGETIDSVRDGYDRAKEAVTEMDPAEALDATGRTIREAGDTVARSITNHPFVAFGLGALSVGLIAWSQFGDMAPRRRSFWDRARGWDLPDWSFDDRRLRGLLPRFDARDAADHGRSFALAGRDQAMKHGRHLADQALDGGRRLAASAGREPVATLIGLGIALYAVGSILAAGSSGPAPARRRPAKR